MLTFLNRLLMKTTEYLDHFARFKRKENVEAVERLLSAHKELAKFERAQLGRFTATASILPTNLLPYSKARDLFFEKRGGQCADILHAIGSLCCDSSEEAKTLIPSLQDKITDDDLQELLDEITKLMGYGN